MLPPEIFISILVIVVVAVGVFLLKNKEPKVKMDDESSPINSKPVIEPEVIVLTAYRDMIEQMEEKPINEGKILGQVKGVVARPRVKPSVPPAPPKKKPTKSKKSVVAKKPK